MSVAPGTNKIGDAFREGRKKYARAVYDFADDGGAQGDITLTTTPKIPSGALVTEAIVNTTTAFTSGGAATVALKLEGAADVNAADAISGDPWNAAGVFRADALVGADGGLATTAERDLVMTVGTADLTAGACDVVVEYMELS